MARDPDSGDSLEASHASQECMPCRGSGRVVSSLGGKASKIECPWCGGDGKRHPEVDAQARWAQAAGAASAGAGGDAGEDEAVEAA